MTEAEWLACADPKPILELLRLRGSDRKLRLVACACCRRTEHLYPNEKCRRCLDVLESWADGAGTVEDVRMAIVAALGEWDPEQEREIVIRELIADTLLAFFDFPDSPLVLVSMASQYARRAVAMGRTPYSHDNEIAEGQQQLLLIREITGNPFHPVTFAPGLITPNVLPLAQAAYNERILHAGALDPARLAVLADALEDAGCADAALLGHLRGPGPHVRGCWALDLILGKS
jgi:hypothetical protein